MQHTKHRILRPGVTLLGLALVATSGPAEGAQVLYDAVGTLGGTTTHSTYRVSDTAGLPVVGRATRTGYIEWSGFWFPRFQATTSVPDLPPEWETPPTGPVLPAITRFLGVFPNPVVGDAQIRFEIAPDPGWSPLMAEGSGAGSGAAPGHGAEPGNVTGPGHGSDWGTGGSSLHSSGTGFSSVRLELFDVNGRLASQVFSGELPPGTHHFDWRPASSVARSVSNGIYFVRFTCGTHQETRRVALLR